jgi:enediyne biosynthesis protein E4
MGRVMKGLNLKVIVMILRANNLFRSWEFRSCFNSSSVKALHWSLLCAALLMLSAYPAHPQIMASRPVIFMEPESRKVELGTKVTFAVKSGSSLPTRYQWQMDGKDIVGATQSRLVIADAQPEDVGEYTVIVSNNIGSRASKAGALMLYGAPIFRAQLEDQSLSLGAKAIFSAPVAGIKPLTIQWQKNGEDIPGATQADLTLANITLSDAGAYRVSARNERGWALSREAQLEIDPTFTKILHDPVVTGGATQGGVAFADYDNDGDLDLFLPAGQNRLYRNDGDGSFTRVEGVDPVEDLDGGRAAWGDFDNDGLLDLVVDGWFGREHGFCYRNLGAGKFERRLDILPGGASWVDYDNDGWLDLFKHSIDGCQLYHSEKGQEFSLSADDTLAQAGNDAFWHLWFDFDNDSDLDLLLNNHIGAETYVGMLLENQSNGSFRATVTGFATKEHSRVRGCAGGDYDNDGYFDLFVANGHSMSPSLLYRNDGQGSFLLVAPEDFPRDLGVANGAVWGDYDNDGDLDLYVTFGALEHCAKNALYRNDGNGRFTRIRTGSLVNEVERSDSAAWADYNDDGFLDIYVVNRWEEAVSAVEPHNSLFRNNGNDNHWLKVKCVGTYANRAAIGAKVRVKATIFGKEVWQVRQIVGGDSYGATSILEAHFGLGDAEIIDTVRIEWPGPRFTVQELHNVPVDQFITVVEAQLALKATSSKDGIEIVLDGVSIDKSYALEVSSDLENWETVTVLTGTDKSGRITHMDSLSTGDIQRFYRVYEVRR